MDVPSNLYDIHYHCGISCRTLYQQFYIHSDDQRDILCMCPDRSVRIYIWCRHSFYITAITCSNIGDVRWDGFKDVLCYQSVIAALTVPAGSRYGQERARVMCVIGAAARVRYTPLPTDLQTFCWWEGLHRAHDRRLGRGRGRGGKFAG